MTTGRINQVSFYFFLGKISHPCSRFSTHGTREFIGSGELVPQPVPQPETAAQTHARRLRQAYECWQCGDFAMVDSHGTREFIGGGSGDCGTPMGGANLLRQAYECWPCVDFAMAQSHGTREFIGGGELVPRPETAAQTRGWRQPFETSV